MKDIIVTGKRIKIELIKLLVFFSIAMGLNIYSINNYETDWSELLSQFHIVLIITIILYSVSLIFLLLKNFIRRIIQK